MTNEQKFQFVQFLWEQFPVVVVRASECRGMPGNDPYPKLRLHFPEGKQIPDLTMDLDGFSGTFSYGGLLQEAYVPWEAVLAIEAGGTYVAFPPCAVTIGIPRGEPLPDEITRKIERPGKGGLTLVKGGKS
jgi:hypothetical protein